MKGYVLSKTSSFFKNVILGQAPVSTAYELNTFCFETSWFSQITISDTEPSDPAYGDIWIINTGGIGSSGYVTITDNYYRYIIPVGGRSDNAKQFDGSGWVTLNAWILVNERNSASLTWRAISVVEA